MLVIMIITFILIANPTISLEGALAGLSLWFETILPTLLPFMIISYLIQNVYCTRIKNPNIYIILIGLLCGFPMGANCIGNFLKLGKITEKNAYILLMCCNVSSPAFIISYVCTSSLNLTNNIYKLLLLNYLPIVFVLFYYIIINRNTKIITQSQININLNLEIIDEAVTNSINNSLKMCVYIVVFSIFSHFIMSVNIGNEMQKALLTGLFEITNGISLLSACEINNNIKILLIFIINAFGGLSCAFQSFIFLKDTNIQIKKYMYNKILLATLTAIIWYLMVHVLNIL